MANNAVVQQDNAVLDYTTISSLITAVNNHEVAIQSISDAQQHLSVLIDPNTGEAKVVQSGQQKTQAGSKQVPNGQSSVTITFPTPFTAKPIIVGTVLRGGTGTAPTCWISTTPTATEVTFKVSAKSDGHTYIQWVAVGA